MKLFEASWKEGYTFFERYYDTDLKKSVKNEINLPYEWYEPSSRGLYTAILDETLKLDRKQGNAKQGREHFGFLDPMYRNIRDNYWNCNSYNLKPRVMHLDIETRVGTQKNSTGFPVPDKALEPISMIQIMDTVSEQVIMLGVKEWKHKSDYEDKFEYPLNYIVCKDEFDLIDKFINIFQKLDPLIIYAWNGNGFDFPYLFNRFKKLGFDPKSLSNYGDVKLKESEFQGQVQYELASSGHFFIDMMEVYQKFTFKPQASYSLDAISTYELKENKVEHPEYVSFDDFYTGNYLIPEFPNERQKNSKIYNEAITNGINEEVNELGHSEFCYYSYKDPLLIFKIDKKLNLTTLMLMIAEKMGVQVGDSMGTVKPWSQYIANKSFLDNKIMPPRKEHPHPNIVGGFVRDPVKGMHSWVLSEDVNSMYPLLGMVAFNMSPETFVHKKDLHPELRDIIIKHFGNQDEVERLEMDEDIWTATTELLKRENISLGINGATFSKDKLGMIPEMVQNIYNTRKEAKKTMFKYQQKKVHITDILKKRKLNENK